MVTRQYSLDPCLETRQDRTGQRTLSAKGKTRIVPFGFTYLDELFAEALFPKSLEGRKRSQTVGGHFVCTAVVPY